MKLGAGVFTISLDFEMYWGVRDKRSIENYRQNLLGVPAAVTEILKTFSEYDIHATWATVGFLFFRDSRELGEHIPSLLPAYANRALSPYSYIGAGEVDPAFHFAPGLIENIRRGKGQEIGTHTFSHFYCLEEGQSVEQFEADLQAALSVAERKGIRIRSVVFPRNQMNARYLSSISGMGIMCYRGNENHWAYRGAEHEKGRAPARVFRLADSYVNLSGHHTYDMAGCGQGKPYNIPASRFLRPYDKRYASLERLRAKRIMDAMTEAAAHKKVFHLWWHPHNFGVHLRENMEFLSGILRHYARLRERYGFVSLNMGEIAQLLEGEGRSG